jgi:TnpA family transposase
VLDRWGIVYDQPLPLSTRQAGAAIEGAVRQSFTKLERLAVDTHGYSDFALGIAKLLGFDLCPRLSSLRNRHLHVPRNIDVSDLIEPMVRRDVSLNALNQYWDDLLRTAATIEQGWRSATDVLERFGSAARAEGTFRAGHALGQLLRTIYLCDYFTIPSFRQRIFNVLERGEAVHALQRQIYTGPQNTKRGRRIDELSVISGAITLLTNAVMAWNTWQLDMAVQQLALPLAKNKATVNVLRHIGPVAYKHINFRGTYAFHVEKHESKLIKVAA